jgi:hypothetical protein
MRTVVVPLRPSHDAHRPGARGKRGTRLCKCGKKLLATVLSWFILHWPHQTLPTTVRALLAPSRLQGPCRGWSACGKCVLYNCYNKDSRTAACSRAEATIFLFLVGLRRICLLFGCASCISKNAFLSDPGSRTHSRLPSGIRISCRRPASSFVVGHVTLGGCLWLSGGRPNSAGRVARQPAVLLGQSHAA